MIPTLVFHHNDTPNMFKVNNKSNWHYSGLSVVDLKYIAAGIYLFAQSQLWKHLKDVFNLFRVNNKTTERRHWRGSGVFIVNFE